MSDLPPGSPERRPGPPWVMEDMIAAEAGLPAGIVEQSEAAEGIARAARDSLARGEPVSVVGCGTSEHGAMAVAEQLGWFLGPAALVHSRQAFEAALDPWEGGLCIGISHEGETKATIAAMRATRDLGAKTALITAAAGSPAASEADLVLVTPLLDRSWCHTVGYLSPVLAGGLIAATAADEAFDPARLGGLIAAVSGADPAARAANVIQGMDRVVAAGGGTDGIAARELALKVCEGVRLPAAGFDLESILHGHLAAHDERTAVVVIVTDPRHRERRTARADQVVRAARRIGMPTVTVGTTPDATVAVPEPATVLESLVASALALQLLTVALAHRRGVNPDLIRREEAPYREAAAIAESAFVW